MQADTYEQVYKICLQDYHTVEIGQWDFPIPPGHALAKWYLSSLVGQAALKNYNPLRLEEALRSLAGTRPQTGVCAEDAALQCLVDVFERTPDDENSWDPEIYDPKAKSELAKAHSIAAYAYYRKYMSRTTPIETRGELNALAPDDPLAFLVRAARHASHAAVMQLLTPAVLLAGFALRTCLLDMPMVPDVNPYFLQLRPLWRALERCEKRWPARKPALDSDPPPTYDVCAAAECQAAVVVGDRFKLAEDYSGCPDCTGEEELAPFYCSRECRDQDWATHQRTCKAPGSLRAPIETSVSRRTHQRNALREMSRLVKNYTHYEVMVEDSESTDPLGGSVVWRRSLSCPLGTPLKTVPVVKRTYSFQDDIESC